MDRVTENENLPTTAGRRKSARIVTVLVTGVLLTAVAATVTHNPIHPPASAANLVVVQGDPIEPAPLVAAPAPATSPAALPPLPTVAPADAPKISDGYAEVGFDRLAAFPLRTKWVMTDPIRIKGEQQLVGSIPDAIKALNSDKIAVKGFMLPLKMSGGLVSDFFLMRTQAKCCFGLPIQVNELLTVHMTGKGVKSLMDQPVTIYGIFHVAETRDTASGNLDAIYTLDGDKMVTSTL
jgi:hypothetical protein